MNNDYGMSEISLDGFQLVRGQLFARAPEPSMSIWYSSISFNVACYSALNECVSIQLMVNSAQRKILVKSCPSKDRDAVNWQKAPGKHKSKKIECSKFMHHVFELWGLDKDYHYRATGKLVMTDKKVMLLFDFSEPETWRGMKMVNDFYISDEINAWIYETYNKHGVNIYKFCEEWVHYFYSYPDMWPKGHKKKSEYYADRSKYGVDLNSFLFWDYDYKQKNNLFGLDSLYRSMPKKSFIRGKKQEIEATLMYCWLHGVTRDHEYWCEYSETVLGV